MRYTFLATVAAAALMLGVPLASAQTSGSPDSPSVKRPPAHETTRSSEGASQSAPGRLENRSSASSEEPGLSETAPGRNRSSAQSDASGQSEAAPGQARRRDSQDMGSPKATGATGEKSADSELSKRPPEASRSATSSRSDAEKASQSANGKKADDASKSAAEGNAGSQNRSTADSERRGSGAKDSRNSGAASNESSSPTRQGAMRETSGKGEKSESRTDVSSSASVSGSVARLDTEKRSDVIRAFSSARANVVSDVNFRVSVGTTVSEHVHLAPVPEEIVRIVPQFRGYDYVIVRDEIVIVHPRTRKIVEVIQRRGGSSSKSASIHLTKEQRHRFKTSVETTGSTRAPDRIELREGVTLPDDVVLEDVPDTIITEVPAIREYRYVVIGNDIGLVEPQTRRVIEVFPE
jgi:hypothetical protein